MMFCALTAQNTQMLHISMDLFETLMQNAESICFTQEPSISFYIIEAGGTLHLDLQG